MGDGNLIFQQRGGEAIDTYRAEVDALGDAFERFRGQLGYQVWKNTLDIEEIFRRLKTAEEAEASTGVTNVELVNDSGTSVDALGNTYVKKVLRKTFANGSTATICKFRKSEAVLTGVTCVGTTITPQKTCLWELEA